MVGEEEAKKKYQWAVSEVDKKKRVGCVEKQYKKEAMGYKDEQKYGR